MPGACRLRQFWRFNLILTIVGSWVRKQRAGGGASVVRVCASIIACSLAIGSGRPATTSGVAILGACSRSGHVADAQVGEIPGFARLPPPPGWRKCPPLVIVSTLAEMERCV